MRTIRYLFILITGLALLTGCAAVGPDYTPPETIVKGQWQAHDDPAVLPDRDLIVQWWTLFNDPVLNRLIEKTAANNLDLLTAVARVEETRSRLGITVREANPEVNAQVGVTRSRTSENSVGTGYEKSIYAPGIIAGWELDLFGRIRRSVEAATAQYQASEEDRTDVLISVYAVEGILLRSHFSPGQVVKKGQLLYTIQPGPAGPFPAGGRQGKQGQVPTGYPRRPDQ